MALILCEQMERAYESSYFLYFEATKLSENYIINNPDSYKSQWCLGGFVPNDDGNYVLGKYSTEEIAKAALLYLVDKLKDELPIVNVPTEEHLIEMVNNS